MRIDKQKVLIILARQCLERKEVAAALGMSPSNFNRLLRNGKTTPATLGHIAKYLGVDVTELLADE